MYPESDNSCETDPPSMELLRLLKMDQCCNVNNQSECYGAPLPPPARVCDVSSSCVDLDSDATTAAASTRSSSDVGAIATSGYTHHPRSCVIGENVILYTSKTVEECAELCDGNTECLGFEYGVDYGTNSYSAGDCQLSSGMTLASNSCCQQM